MSEATVLTTESGPRTESSGRSAAELHRAKVLDGRPLAAEMRRNVRRQLGAFKRRYGFSPVLAAVMVGRERASSVYVEQILRSTR
ncbi:MAG TPA: hypothetical protein VEX62_01120, partial [Candidatus Limnocylindrales bacterium]|nr:hypothetical protein [Candidatus Limnocylindrales bacterium]